MVRATICAGMIAGFAAAGAGADTVSDMRAVDGFHKVVLALPARLTLVQGDAETVLIEADEAVIDRIRSRVRRGELQLELDEPTWAWWRRYRGIDISVTFKSLDAITVSGSGHAESAAVTGDRLALTVAGSGSITLERLEVDTLHLLLSGSGDVTITDLTADRLMTRIEGSGDVRLGGVAREQDVGIYGSGKVDAGEVATSRSRVSVYGSGDVSVWADETLDVELAGSGDVAYRGEATVRESISGSGSVRKR